MAAAKRPSVLVSSTVYGIEELLERIYVVLVGLGYDVWMSHKGTLPVRSGCTAFENCLRAVEDCDLFFSIITTAYGSGKDGSGNSITHQELERAIALDKPRWVLTHSDVVFARRLLRDLGLGTKEKRSKLNVVKGASSVSDLRVIDLYELAIRDGKPLADRKGNWVQAFRSDEDAMLFASAQFSRYQEAENFVQANFAKPEGLKAETSKRRGKKK